jgi:hypothetical protein
METRIFRNRLLSLIFLSILTFFLLLEERVRAEEKIVIGAIENVILLPWGIMIPARIDTGAATSSLDVCELKRRDKKEVEFKLPKRCGGMRLRLPVIAWRIIQSSEGPPERRPVVEMEFCLGTKQLRTLVTLNDRSHMEFPLLVGRKTLEGNFIVDVSRTNTIPPNCPEAMSP